MAGSNASEFNEDRLASIVRSVSTALQGDSTVTAKRSSTQTSVEDELRSRFQHRTRVTGLHDSLVSGFSLFYNLALTSISLIDRPLL